MSRAEIARRLFALLRPLSPTMAVSGAARVINHSLGVAIPAVAAATVVGFVADGQIGGFALLIFGMALVKGTFRYVEQFTGHAVAFRLLADLRNDVFRHLVPLAPAGLEEERTGDLVARLIGDIDRVEPFYAHTIAPLTSAVIVPMLTTAGLAIWVDPMVAATFLPFPVLLVWLPWVRARRVANLAVVAGEQAGETSAIFTDSIQGAREIAIFEADMTVKGRMTHSSEMGAAVERELAGIAAVRSGGTDLLAGLAVVAVSLVAITRFDSGMLDVAGLATSIVVSWVGLTPARAVEEIVPDLDRALAAAGRLFALADREPPVKVSPGTALAPQDGSIRFDRVSVTFPRSSRRVLGGIDVEIADGSLIGLVGPSGAGKSTLVELLVRFRDPDVGRVELGGLDLKQLDPAELSRHVALVPQRPDLFFGTVADNLRLARPDAGYDEMWAALERAALAGWVHSLERGLKSAIGELGETMSGGQRQRLAMARAFLRDPRVLVLDESTSELDRSTEAAVLAEIGKERGRRTVIVVAHRIDTVIDADEILVLDGGTLVERGTHSRLLAVDGVYARLWQRHLDVVPTPI